MTRPMRIVAPFRPFQPESPAHQALADFDWSAALQMMAESAARACRCPVHALTDVDTTLTIPVFRYRTAQRRLMLWTLDVCAAYLASDDFDCDTVMLDVDQLVYRDLQPFFTRGVDLGVLVRTTEKHVGSDQGNPLLNGVQFWPHRSRVRLARFYRQALELALTLPESSIVWGADTHAVRLLIDPIQLGIHRRAGLRVEMIAADRVVECFSTRHAQSLADRHTPRTSRPVLDFRNLRKRHMGDVYRAMMRAGATR